MNGNNPNRTAGQGRGAGGGAGGASGGKKGRGFGGPGGFCLCPSCGEKVKHSAGTPCFELTCPKCHTQMIRDRAAQAGRP